MAALGERIDAVQRAEDDAAFPRIVVLSKTLNLDQGLCRLQCQLLPPGTKEEEVGGMVVLDVDCSVRDEEDRGGVPTPYPFASPALVVVRGAEVLPASFVRSRDNALVLPVLEAWTPNMGILEVLLAARDLLLVKLPTRIARGQSLSLDLFADRLFPGAVVQQQGVLLSRYLGITENRWLCSVKAHETRLETVVVAKAQELLNVSKLKYKRAMSLSIEFRDGDRWDYQMPGSAECVEAIQAALKDQHGVVGRRTSQSALNNVARAKALLQEAQRREAALAKEGGLTFQRVQDINDLYREAIEKYSMAASVEHKEKVTEAITLLQGFLSRPDVQDALENKPPKPAARRSPLPSPSSFLPSLLTQPKTKVGEVLARPAFSAAEEDDDSLAREEKRLGSLSKLKQLLDLNLNDPSSATRNRTSSADSISSSSGGVGGGGGSGRPPAGGSVDMALHELDVVLGEATRELESLSSLPRREAMTAEERAAAAAAEEEEIAI